ncbi:hypothetical protein [Parasitella parasitica]|uniref:Uncharacterized protein n=1 Tax=Parasitella parasitica TaxID=35722 RepID=A0A0B7NFF0_9FUNG|nr:hypothetical protein [Parasitella parasitica]
MIENHDLKLQDFKHQEVEASYRLIFIDPGRKSVFTANKREVKSTTESRRKRATKQTSTVQQTTANYYVLDNVGRKEDLPSFMKKVTKVPLLVFDDGVFNKDSAKLKGLETGAAGVQ